jgi:hypothetical protein
MRRMNSRIHSRSYAAKTIVVVVWSAFLVCCVGAFHTNRYHSLVRIHEIGSSSANPTINLIDSVEHYKWLPSSNKCPLSRRGDKYRGTSLYALLESGINPLQSIAIFTAVLFILSTQREIDSVDRIIFDAKKELETVPEKGETSQDLLQEVEPKEDVNATTTEEASTKVETINDEEFSIIEEEMTGPSDNSPTYGRSYSSTVSFATPDIDEMKKRVASTLASERAKKKMLEEQLDGASEKSEEYKSKSMSIEFPRKSKKKSRMFIRIVKKVIMPWKKFSQLS